jgi:energy-coupling factor transporter ATP-binding protein EcfA2
LTEAFFSKWQAVESSHVLDRLRMVQNGTIVTSGENRFDLHTLGWRNFQDLCHTIVREIFGQTVERFLDGNDAGRDGAFCGTWKTIGGDNLAGQFVIQCKFTSKAGSSISTSDLREELVKAQRLVEKGLCDAYILITNAGISGRTNGELRKIFSGRGVKEFRSYGSDWIHSQIRESPRLRALVPRAYGIGDISEIFDARADQQTRALIAALREDLSKVVVTSAYRKAYAALEEYSFVLLLGEPAAGKTTIASMLAMVAIDQWNISAMKLESSSKVIQHWNPNQNDSLSRLFWVDDAFGATQYEAHRAYSWNHVFPQIRAMLRNGNRIILTSRDYIYNRARNDLKDYAFPFLKESQVVVEVANLTLDEKRNILYNHMRLGRQSRKFRSAIKEFLDEDVAAQSSFVPETARRLSEPLFTKGLPIDRTAIHRFVQSQGHLIRDVLRSLDQDNKAALALIFMRGGALQSPIEGSVEVSDVLARFGSDLGACITALQSLAGSLVRYARSDHAPVWKFRHPTVEDAVGEMLKENPELLGIYLRGSNIEVLLDQISCGNVGWEHALVVPAMLFPIVVTKLRAYSDTKFPSKGGWWGGWGRIDMFLARRCDAEFLKLYVSEVPATLDRVADPPLALESATEVDLAVRLFETGLFPEQNRKAFVETIGSYAVEGDDAGALQNPALRKLFVGKEWNDLLERVRSELLPNLGRVRRNWESNSYGDPESIMQGFLDLVSAVQKSLPEDQQIRDPLEVQRQKAEEWIAEHTEERRPTSVLAPLSPISEIPAATYLSDRSIFDDVDL